MIPYPLSRLLAIAVVLAFTAGAAATREQPGFRERVEVSRLLIDVRVLDPQGRAITDLQPGDFEIKVGGRQARVESVQWIASGTPLPLDLPAGPGRGRLVVFLFQKDLEPSRIVGLMRMLMRVRPLLDTFTPEDRVAVLSFDTQLKFWVDFTNRFERVREALEHAILFEESAAARQSPPPSLMERLTVERARRTWTIEDALAGIGEALGPLPGAKSVVFVGHGFGEYGLSGVTQRPAYDKARDALIGARAAVFSLDVTEADYHSLEAGLQLAAADTGGFFARSHLFPDVAVARLEGALAGHYVLFVEQPALDPGAHELEVRMMREGTVLANRKQFVSR